jgi:hypothetical protein
MSPLCPLSEFARPRPSRTVVGLLLVAVLAAAVVNGFNLVKPGVWQDDFQILAQSWTWEKTWSGLWVPQNEHAMPLGRLLTFGVDHLAGRQSNVPLAAALVGPVALLLALPLVYRFVGRELAHPLYGILAVIFFGITSVYAQAVYWFAASFSIWALDMLLLGLLAAQNYRHSGSLLQLGLCALWCTLSPCWFASGILAGPLCCVYLLWPERIAPPRLLARLRSLLGRMTPLSGTLLFLAVSLPLTAQSILNTPHYQALHKNAWDAFHLGKGFALTCRSLVENLLVGVAGASEVPVPWWLVFVVLAAVVPAAGWWWWRAPDRRLLVLGVAFIFSSYMLVYSARAEWFLPDDRPAVPINEPRWSRYHLLPQLGLMLFVCGGLPRLDHRRFPWAPDELFLGDYAPNLLKRLVLYVRRQLRILLETTADGTIPSHQVRNVIVLIVLLFLTQLPRGVVVSPMWYDLSQQQADFGCVEAVDACCREQRIDAAAARRCLPRWKISLSADDVNGWEFLRGSADPVDRSDEEVTAVLKQCN